MFVFPSHSFQFKNVTAINPDGIDLLPNLEVKAGKFKYTRNITSTIDLSNYYIYPGLINSHDHLLGNYLPKVGRGPYLSWKPWDDDLKAAELYQERGLLSNSQIYKLGYYRQILSGVTTVCDHIPHIVHQGEITTALVRIIEQFCLAHEISSYELKWGDSHEVEIARAKKNNIPFITHLEEGFDDESKRGTDILDAKKGIFQNSVLVHCVSCSIEDIKLIARKGASMVWCPNSNYYMFNQTAKIKEFLLTGVNVCLGTDSPMSGSINLLEEIRFAQKTYKELYGEKLDPQQIFRMVTINGAKAFILDEDIGSINEGKKADFLIMKKKSKDPYQQLIEAYPQDIELVVRDGIPLSWSDQVASWLTSSLPPHEKVTLQNHKGLFKRNLIGKPLEIVHSMEKQLRFKKKLDFFPAI